MRTGARIRPAAPRPRAAGGTGRRARLRGVWGDPSGFESRAAHHHAPRPPGGGGGALWLWRLSHTLWRQAELGEHFQLVVIEADVNSQISLVPPDYDTPHDHLPT